MSRESLPPHLSQGNDAEAADKCTGMGSDSVISMLLLAYVLMDSGSYSQS